MPPEELLTVKDLQKICQIGRSTAYALISTKQLKAVRINRVVRIRRSDLDQYLHDNESSPKAQW
jgi:excisionase family DNA binding protein